uniref:Tail protein n=1 Tax=Siphoviridae sp. ctC6Q17 TaxID=2827271 RepID=A0A8S5R3G1_9CAUD|nr:MAG TPA: tail protein [Siphoviridae sp. ctC6Q17]
MSKLIATSQLTMTNLLERAETRRETFYKLTNSADVPTAPSGGGRNLLTGTRDWSSNIKRWANNNGVWNDEPDEYNNLKVKSTTGGWNGWHQNVFVKAGEYYTLSYYAKSDTNINVRNSLTWVGSPVFEAPVATFDGNNDISDNITTDWKRYSRTVKITGDGSLQWRIEYNGKTIPSGKLYIAGMKLEKMSSASNYSVAPEDLGWSIDTLVPTQTNRYLWKFDYVYYSDSSVEVSKPVNLSIAGQNGAQGLQGPQGIQGPQGPDGRTQYTHIAYADNATGGGFSQTDQTKAYIGMYVDFTATDSNDPTKYRWTKWKGSDGAQGIPGPKGADGKIPYIHFAYADDNKGTNFSLTDKNQQYQGYYSDYTEADSTDYTKYKWVDRLANIKGGSRNYFKNSLSRTFNTTNDGTFDFRTFIVNDFWKNKDRLKKNFVKISFDITFPAALTNDYIANIHFSATPWYSNKVTFKAGTTSRQHFEFAIDLSSASENYYTDNVFIRFGTNYGFPSNFKIILENMMLSIGSYYPDYIQAIEDTQEQIDNKADQTLTQDQLNALAEKNNLIKAEMEAKASIDTVNQWITAYQNYVNANNADKAKSEQDLKEASERIVQMKYEVGNLKLVWDAIDTYMSFQNEGLIIGKKDGSAYAKFSDDRISLFSGSSEVMYISQGTLNIANGIFTKTIQIGRFRFETHPADADMLVVRFVGG